MNLYKPRAYIRDPNHFSMIFQLGSYNCLTSIHRKKVSCFRNFSYSAPKITFDLSVNYLNSSKRSVILQTTEHYDEAFMREPRSLQTGKQNSIQWFLFLNKRSKV